MSDYKQQNNIEEDDEIVIDVSRLFDGMKKGFKKLWVLLIIICVGAGALSCGISMFKYTPRYRATASFTVSTIDNVNSLDASYGFDYNTRTTSQLTNLFPYILESDVLQDLVKDSLGVDEINGSMGVNAVSDSNLFTVQVVSDSAEEARTILEAVMTYIPEVSKYVIGDTKLNMLQIAKAEDEPYNTPNYVKRGVFGFVLGIIIDIIILLIYSLVRKTIRTNEDMKNELNMNALGNIPMVSLAKRKGNQLIIFNKKTGWQFIESVRSLCIKIERRMKKKQMKVLMVTSTMPEEGKTTVSTNIAAGLVEKGKKVLLLDLDLRNPSVATALKISDNQAKLEAVLEGKENVQQAAVQLESGLNYLGVSKPVSDPMSLLTKPQLASLIEEYKQAMDYIIIDVPPCGILSDAGTVSEHCDGILYVIKKDFVKESDIRNGIQNVASRGTAIIGGVLNGSDYQKASYGYGKYGQYGYGRKEK